MSFKNFLNEINESLNTPVQIYKSENKNNLKFLYFKINDKNFRAVIEKVEDESALIFEQQINDSYTYSGIQNNLSSKEVLSLFSTLKTLLQHVETDKNYVFTDSYEKARIYLKILNSMKEINSINYTEDHKNKQYVIGFSYSKEIVTNPSTVKFKWKVN